MNTRRSLVALCLSLLALAPPARAAEPVSPAETVTCCGPAPACGCACRPEFVPTIFGDYFGPGVSFFGTTPASQAARATLQIPTAARAGAKIAENESPRPTDRFFATYHYYNNINGSIRPLGLALIDYHRQTIGLEKTVLDGAASLGFRLPTFQLAGDPTVETTEIGNLTLIAKYALVDDTDASRLLSTGLALTVPTGKNVVAPGAPNINPVLVQPYLGYLWRGGDFLVQGFSSLVVPLDSRDATLLFNDVQFGCLLYRARSNFLSSVWPVFEVHVNTPLTQRGSRNTPVGVADSVIFTAGAAFVFCERCAFNLGAATPMTGPQPFDVEGILQFNFQF